MSIQWRPVVAEGQIDRSLTAVSNAVFDVQEDGLRLAWQLGLEFRGGQREQFRVNLPAGYLLEKVEGNNVRGWEIHKTDRGQSVEVTLLQPAKDYERFTLRLWRGGPVGQKEMAQFDVPQVTVTDAALHTGQLTIRHSPLLELRTLDRSGVTRTDLPAASRAMRRRRKPAGHSAVRGVHVRGGAVYGSAVGRAGGGPRVGHGANRAETRRVRAEPGKQRQPSTCRAAASTSCGCCCPTGCGSIACSAPGAYQYAVTKQGKRSLLTIYLADGQEGSVQVRIRGRLGGEGAMIGDAAADARRPGRGPPAGRRGRPSSIRPSTSKP